MFVICDLCQCEISSGENKTTLPLGSIKLKVQCSAWSNNTRISLFADYCPCRKLFLLFILYYDTFFVQYTVCIA